MTPSTQTQLDLLIHHFQQMDLVMLHLLLDDNLTYQDMPKLVFLQKLAKAFAEFRENGNTQLLPFPGFCKEPSCHGGKPGLQGRCFVGDSSPHYLVLIIEVKDGKVTDLFECASMGHNDIVPQKQHRIFINDDDMPF
ncbi:hypothetical protein [Flavihumibacter profundi]|uniref:hypothetical protein n=1 Tax=Flavihumibacter profundi TaxID=2716883 RepID=UPI001CC5B6D3|nr:hypothetical protein [Flavihumibacter profundi]MBZ5857547.1 hypothetical protein [Flavihumibacter profundi]